MNGPLETWEMVALGAVAIAVTFFFFPGVKRAIERSRNAEKDWPGFLLPIGAVILFVIVLILMVS